MLLATINKNKGNNSFEIWKSENLRDFRDQSG